MWRADDAIDAALRWERNRSRHLRAGTGRRVHDLARGLVDDLVVVGLEADPDLRLRRHSVSFFLGLLEDLRHTTGTDGAATFTDREAESFLHRDRLDQLDRHR